MHKTSLNIWGLSNLFKIASLSNAEKNNFAAFMST